MRQSGKIAFIFSVSIEMLQLLLRLGTFQLSDIFYNTVGGVLGGVCYCGIKKAMLPLAFSVVGIREMDLRDNYVELLVHPLRKEIVVRPTNKENRCAIQWANGVRGYRHSRSVAAKAYIHRSIME